jgi:exopolyphosphatase/guanosine-5'-triphosphate,3'-diphosphate pyrophosphatase
MRVAIIDMGTNTFNLLIQDLEQGELLYKDKRSVKLGEGGIDSGKISDAAFARGIDALKAHQQTISNYAVDATYAFATSAVRDAENQAAFLKACKGQAGITINVISGKEEAELIYEGVKQATDLGQGKHLIVDIGGGSTECILCDKEEVHWLKSHQIGSSRLKEKFKPADPVSAEDRTQIDEHLSKEMKELLDAVSAHKPETIIGSSGSFDTLLAMIFEHQNKSNPLLEGATSCDFDLGAYYEIADQMYTRPLDERLRIPGMLPMRADLMPMACLLIDFLLKQTGVKKLRQSSYALKEGVAALLLKNEHTWLKSY